MKADPKVIQDLNEILTGELTAINQYFLHARMCKDWGYHKMAAKLHAESIEEMKHASDLVDRVLFLEGLPNLQKLFPLRIGENVEEQLKNDLALEHDAIPRLKEAINHCTKVSDHATRDLLEKILVNEEEHVDWIETQLHMIETMGIQNYLSLQSSEV